MVKATIAMQNYSGYTVDDYSHCNILKDEGAVEVYAKRNEKIELVLVIAREEFVDIAISYSGVSYVREDVKPEII